MPGQKHTPAQIIDKLRTVERLRADGNPVEEAVAQIGVTVQTYYRWRNRYQNMDKSDAKRLKELEKENARLKKLVANLSLQNDILKETVQGNF